MPPRHEQTSRFRRALGRRSAPAATRAAQAEGRSTAGLRSGRPGRDPLRAADRLPLGVAATGAGLRQRGHLLAAAARLAAGRGLAPLAHRALGAARGRRPARLEPREPRLGQPSGQKGGEETGPNPVDRGKPGSKRHLLVDRRGAPLAVWLSAANVHDSVVFEALIEPIEPIKRPGPGRPRTRPGKLHADKAYDLPRYRAYLRRRGIGCRIARIGLDSSEKLGRHRWVVERTLAWLARFRRLAVRYERLADLHLALLDLGCALICFRLLQAGF